MAALSSGWSLTYWSTPCARQVMRIQLMPGRHRGRAGKRPILVDQIPTPAHDRQQRFERGIGGGLQEREAGEIALPPVNVVQQAAGFDELVDHPALALCQSRGAERHVDVLPLGEPGLDIAVLRRQANGHENRRAE